MSHIRQISFKLNQMNVNNSEIIPFSVIEYCEEENLCYIHILIVFTCRSQHVGVMAKDNIQLCYSKLLDTLRMFVFEDSTELEYFKVYITFQETLRET